MPSDTRKLIIELQAKVERYNKKVVAAGKKTEKFQKDTSKAFNRVEKSSKSAGDSLFRFSNVAKGVFAAIGARELVMFADDIQMANNQLMNVTKSTEEFNLVSKELNKIAIETRQNINDLTKVYSRFTRAGQEAGFSQEEVLEFTENLTKAFKIEGNTVAEVNSVLIQLTQGFRSGRIAGEEFRALSEGSTLALQALAKQLGVTVGELKEMAAQGEVTPRALVSGLRQVSPQIEEEFAKLAPTFAEVGTQWGNAAAIAYNDSFLSKAIDGTKGFLNELAIAWAESNKTFETEDEIVKRISEINKQLEMLGEGATSDMRAEISSLNNELNALFDKLFEIRKFDIPAAGFEEPELKITEGKEDPRIQQEKDFIEAINELHAENVATIEERFIFDIEANKAALDAKLIDIRQFHKQQEAIAKDFAKSQENLDKKKQKNSEQNLKLEERHVRQSMRLAAILFEDNKAVSAGIAFVNTAQGITKALASQDYVGAALTAAIGAAQINSILSASRGGGTPSTSVGGGDIGGGQQTGQQETFEPETSSLDLTEQTEQGITTQRLILETRDGNELFTGIVEGVREAERRGR